MLAREVTRWCTAPSRSTRAERASAVLFGEDIATLAGRRCAGGVRRRAVDRDCRRTRSTARASALVDLVARVQLAPSKSEARRLVQSGGVYVNNRRDRGSRRRG